jgi:hypothetical protein
MAGLDRRVRGEDALVPGLRHRLLKIFPRGHFFADQFQRKERGMAFVQVEHGRLHAERAQEAHAADAQQDFLHDAHGAVAGVGARSQVAEMLRVFRQIRVEQIHRDATGVDTPGAKINAVHADFRVADKRLAVGVEHGLERHVLRVNHRVVFGLPVVGINRLLEIAFAVKKADADEAEAEVAGGLGVVAGQNAEAAR